MKPQYVVIDQQIYGHGTPPFLHPNTPLPQYMLVDYFRYYQLKCIYKSILISDNLDIYKINSVYNSITINTFSDISETISLSSGDHRTFRADKIIINDNFNAPLGSELNLIPLQQIFVTKFKN